MKRVGTILLLSLIILVSAGRLPETMPSASAEGPTAPSGVASALGRLNMDTRVVQNVQTAQSKTMPQALDAEEPIPCPMPLPSDEIEGETIVCGQITVPEDWDDPENSPEVTITYARQLSYSESPFADPILFFVGGPGGSILASIGDDHFDFSYLRETRDVILFDPRGNSYSSPLFCPPQVEIPDAEAHAEEMQALPSFDLTGPIEDQLAAAVAADEALGWGRCGDYFRDQGIDLSHYGTADSVRDTVALMDHLDYPAYNLLAISYGTTVALSLLDYYEQSGLDELPAARSALVDGVYPLNLPPGDSDGVFSIQLAVLRLFEACEEDPACAEAYPNIRQRAIDLLNALDAEPLTLEDGSEVTSQDLGSALTRPVSQRLNAAIPYLPRMIAELEEGNTATYKVVNGIADGSVSVDAVSADDASLDPIAAQAASLATELRDIAASVDDLGTMTGDLEQAAVEAGSLSDLYLALVTRYIERADVHVRDEFAKVLVGLAQNPLYQTRDSLVALAGVLGLPAEVNELSRVATAMTDEDAPVVISALSEPEFLVPLSQVNWYTHNVVNCNDRVPFLDLEAYLERLENNEPGTILAINLDFPQSLVAKCQLLGLAEPGTEAFPKGATSDIRTLVFNSTLDLETPVEAGEVAFETLTNADMITFAASGHGATRYSDCARDIAYAFFTYPDAEFDQSCVESLKPVWVLPDDVLPSLGLEGLGIQLP